MLFQGLLERGILPLEVRRKDNLARVWVDGPGGADADTADLFEREIGFVDRVPNAARHPLHHRVEAARGLGAQLDGLEQLELRGEDAGKDFGPPRSTPTMTSCLMVSDMR